MRHIAGLLSTAAAFICMTQPTTASAQTQPAGETPPTAPADTDQQVKAKQQSAPSSVIAGKARSAESEGPGNPGAAAVTASPTASDGDIIVTGIRQSLASSAAIKRNSDAILDAVVAQDIGKLPDDTAAESLARIAGVQVNRYNDEVTQVLIRGLPNVATSYNGREVFTAASRQVALQDFPAQALAGIEVYKSGTADIIEPGLAGLVNVRTRRPFDFKDRVVAGGARVSYNDQSRQYNPSGNILLSDRWDTGIGEIGLLLNATYTQSKFNQGIRFNDSYITDASPASIITPASAGRDIRYPYSVGLLNTSGKRWRPSGNFALQWEPNNDLSFYLEGFYQGFREENVTDLWYNDLRSGDPTLSDVVLVDGSRQVRSLLKSGGVRQQAYRGAFYGQTDTYQIALGGKWTTGNATLSTDFAYTGSKYRANRWSVDSALTGPQPVQADFLGKGGVVFSLPGFDVADASKYIWRGYYESAERQSGSGLQWRGDLALETELPFLRTLEFGYRITTRKAAFRQGSRYAATEELRTPFADLPIGDLALSRNPFRDDSQGFTRYLVPSFEGIRGNQDKLRALTRQSLQQLVALRPAEQFYKDSLTAFGPEDVPYDPFSAFHADEKTYTAYLQGKYGFSLGSIDVDGLAGVRAVITNGGYSGTSQTYLNGVRTIVPSDVRQDYLDLLPNASMRVRFTGNLQLRLGYTYTRTKPDFGALNPAFNLTQVVRDPSVPTDPNDPYSAINAFGGGGNPDLKPLTSHNYDASLEWYFSKTGFVSAAVFYRDLFGFIGNYTRVVQDPNYGLTLINRPENAGEGRILGAEGGFQSFLGFLPGALSGFGVQGNVTYLDGTNRTPVFNQNSNDFTYGPFVKITGLSKWAYNAALFYEKSGITTRLSYNRRSAYVNFYGTDVLGRQIVAGTKAISRLDFSFSYDVTKQFTLGVEATNLLAQPYRNYTTDLYGYQYPQDIRDEGRYFGIGARFRFGE